MATRYDVMLPNGNRMRVFFQRGMDAMNVVRDL